MDEVLEKLLRESAEEWADIDKIINKRKKKDEEIVSRFCAGNDYADVTRTLTLLKTHRGMPQHDQEKIEIFESHYPRDITAKDIFGYLDVKDIYRQFLESGGESND